MIAFGCAITNEQEYRAFAGPSIEQIAEPDSLRMRRDGCDSIAEPYNEMLAEAAGREDLEAVVLLHQDASIEDEDFLAKVRSLLAASSEVAIVGVAGVTGAQGPAFPRDAREVESVDGMLLVLSPWAARELRFDPDLGGAPGGYDADLCLQARSRGRRVLAGELRVRHSARREEVDRDSRLRAAVALRRKWALSPASDGPADGSRTAGSSVLSVEQAIAHGTLSLGEHSYGDFGVFVDPGPVAKVEVGRYCSIAKGVEIFVGGNHRPDWVTTYPIRVMFGLPGALADGHPTTRGDVVIGNDVWIGADARIMSGVRIGDGAVIGTGCVVAADVRPYAVVVGNPAQEVRRRFPDEVVEALLRITWWDWPDAVVEERVDELCGPSVEDFVERFGEPGIR